MAELRRCESCGSPLGSLRRADARFCGSACRARAHRLAHQDEIAQLDALARYLRRYHRSPAAWGVINRIEADIADLRRGHRPRHGMLARWNAAADELPSIERAVYLADL